MSTRACESHLKKSALFNLFIILSDKVILYLLHNMYVYRLQQMSVVPIMVLTIESRFPLLHSWRRFVHSKLFLSQTTKKH